MANRRRPLVHGVILTVALLVSIAASGHGQQHDGHPLGVVDFPVSCTPEAQEAFNHAATLLHHMTYPQAREAFRKVVIIDAGCAMAHWGIATTLFQPLWPTRPGLEERKSG